MQGKLEFSGKLLIALFLLLSLSVSLAFYGSITKSSVKSYTPTDLFPIWSKSIRYSFLRLRDYSHSTLFPSANQHCLLFRHPVLVHQLTRSPSQLSLVQDCFSRVLVTFFLICGNTSSSSFLRRSEDKAKGFRDFAGQGTEFLPSQCTYNFG